VRGPHELYGLFLFSAELCNRILLSLSVSTHKELVTSETVHVPRNRSPPKTPAPHQHLKGASGCCLLGLGNTNMK